MKENLFVYFVWRPSGNNQVILTDEHTIYKWYTKTSMTGLATLLKSNIENTYKLVSVTLQPIDGTTDKMVITDATDLWGIKTFARTISRVLAISEFIDKKEWHEPNEENWMVTPSTPCKP